MSPCHSRQPSVISDASAAEGDRSSTPSDINSPRHRTHSLCNVRPAAAGLGPGSCRAGAGGEDVPTVSSRPPREHSGEGTSRSVLSFCKKRWRWGEKRNEARLLLVSGRARKSPEKGRPGSALRCGAPHPLWSPVSGPVGLSPWTWPLHSSALTTPPQFPVASRPSSRKEPDCSGFPGALACSASGEASCDFVSSLLLIKSNVLVLRTGHQRPGGTSPWPLSTSGADRWASQE